MEREHPEIIQPHSTIKPKNEINHQHKFKNHIWGKLRVDVLVIFPTIR